MKLSIDLKQWLRSAALSIAILAGSAPEASACAYGAYGSPGNNYLFSVFNRGLLTDRFVDRTNAIWRQYVGSTDKYFNYRYRREEVDAAIKRKGDSDMAFYVMWLDQYLQTAEVFDSWEYPSRSDLFQRRKKLEEILAAFDGKKSARLQNQYNLMTMRALFGLRRYADCISFWETTGDGMKQDVYREMARNIYAGSLLRSGKRREAIEIYAEQQDFVSLKYLVRKCRNVAGIEAEWREGNHPALLRYLIQDFVNNAQETMDAFGDDYNTATLSQEDQEQMQSIGAAAVMLRDINTFKALAQKAVASSKTQEKALWLAALGCLEHLQGNYREADTWLAKAMKADGTEREKDNARAISIVNSVRLAKNYNALSQKMVSDMKWLDEREEAEDNPETGGVCGHYYDVKARLVFNHLIPALNGYGQHNLALALESVQTQFDSPSSYFFDKLWAMQPEELRQYIDWIGNKKQKDPLAAYVLSSLQREDYFYEDMLATRYMAQGQWQDAILLLERLPLSYLSRQNISPYVAYRNYTLPAWTVHQRMKEEQLSETVSLTSNKKLDFCREMLQMESKYNNMREGFDRQKMAYDLAVRYYQASYEGECWWLTQYGVSYRQDSTLVGTEDFVVRAIEKLNEVADPLLSIMDGSNANTKISSMRSSEREQLSLRENALYARAYIHRNPWYTEGWIDAEKRWGRTVNYDARQYKAYDDVVRYMALSVGNIPRQFSRCDMIQQFINNQQ